MRKKKNKLTTLILALIIAFLINIASITILAIQARRLDKRIDIQIEEMAKLQEQNDKFKKIVDDLDKANIDNLVSLQATVEVLKSAIETYDNNVVIYNQYWRDQWGENDFLQNQINNVWKYLGY